MDGAVALGAGAWYVRLPRLPKLPPLRASAELTDKIPKAVVSINSIDRNLNGLIIFKALGRFKVRRKWKYNEGNSSRAPSKLQNRKTGAKK
ncbi:hypothetical protein [Mesorhizobium sp. Cs1321R2N1]|uniref:hypothetical protein n=1 Tax=Mesorhizobium sp. Cs1321R2N1 TaxID=3015174 RepID=UPI00301CE196